MSPRAKPGAFEQLFVQRLYEEGVISNNVFGVDYRFENETSKIVLGGYDTNVVTDPNLFTYVSLRDTSYWSLPLQSTSYGEQTVNLKATRGVLDTGTSLTYFQTEDWKEIYKLISEGRNWGYSSISGFRACTCNSISEFKDITFQLGDYRYYFPVESWVYEREGDPKICEFLIDSINLMFFPTTILLGDSFLRNYYVLHDAQNLRVGMYGKYTKG